jgi:hypothetical protein
VVFHQVLEALALAEAPPEFEDKLQPDIEGMQKVAKDEIEAFKVRDLFACKESQHACASIPLCTSKSNVTCHRGLQ